MLKYLRYIKEFFLEILFPPYCINCQREDGWLCQDCFSLIDVAQNQYCPFCKPAKIVLDDRTCQRCKSSKNLDGLYSAASYQNFIIKKLISQFKYEPCIKALSKPLSSLIIKHFQLLENQLPERSEGWRRTNVLRLNTDDAVLAPIPLTKKKLKQRGFNQSEEVARELSAFFKVPLISDVLLKTKETPSQVELSGREREENIRGVFLCKNPEVVRGKKIFLVDDVFTTGSTMEECALTLKRAGAKEVWGIVVARE